MSDDANITGRGAEIMVPPQGDPFKAMASAEPTDLTPVEVESQFSSTFGTLDGGMGKAVVAEEQDGVGGIEEPTDLTPADIAAMFPASHDERNAVPEADEPDADPRPMFEAEPSPTDPVSQPVTEPEAPLPGARSARGQTAIPSHDPGRQPKGNRGVDINAFNPDAPIGKPRRMGKGAGRLGKVDIDAFDPNVPVASSDTASADFAMEAPMSEVASIKADIESTESPELTFAPATPPANLATEPVVEPVTPPIDVPFVRESSSLMFEPTVGAEMSGPPVGFQPYDPFAPTGGRPLPEPELSTASVVESAPLASVSATPLSMSVAPSSPPATTPTPTMPAGIVMPLQLVDDDGLTSDNEQNLPTVPPIMLPVAEDESMLNSLVTDSRVQALWIRIDEAEKLAVADENSLPDQRDKNFENIKTARHVLLGGRRNYEDALRYITEVEADLRYANRTRRWSFGYGMGLTAYNVLWVGLLVIGYALASRVTSALAGTVPESYGFAIWITVLAGGFGGVVKGMISLTKHVSKQDFDSQHTLWYLSSPLLGTVLGVFVWIFAQIALTGVNAAASAGSVGGVSSDSINTGGIYLYAALAWLVGFQQNLVFDLADRLKKIILNEKT